MAYIICFLFPTFISLKRLIKNTDKVFDILAKFAIFNVIINLICMLIIWIFTSSRSTINESMMTIPFFIKYTLLSCLLNIFFPYIFNVLNKNIKIEVKKQ